MINIQGISGIVPDAQLFVESVDAYFGGNLLAASRQMHRDDFRKYITASRQLRAKAKGTNGEGTSERKDSRVTR